MTSTQGCPFIAPPWAVLRCQVDLLSDCSAITCVPPCFRSLLLCSHMILKSFLEQFILLLDPEPFRKLARKTRWSKRKSKIDPFDFLISLLFGQMSALRLTLASQAQSFAEPVSRQGIHQRYTPA